MTRSTGNGPGGWPERDEDLDAMLGALGTPELARPETSPAEILGRAALLAPVAAGLAGWKLAATLALAIGGGFLAGVLARGGDELVLEPISMGAVGMNVPAPVEAPLPPEAPVFASPAPEARGSATLARAPGGSRRGGAGVPSGDLAVSTPPEALPPELAPSAACPEPALAHELSQTLQEEDLAAIDELLPAPKGPEAVAPEAVGPEASASAERPRREKPDEQEPEPDPVATLETPARRRLQGSVGAGALVLPGAAGGMMGSASLRRMGEEGRGLTLGGQTDVTLISAAPVGRWSLGLGAELGYTFGRGRVRVEPAWTGTARVVLPSREPELEPDPERPLPPELSSSELAFVPMTGAKLGLSLGGEEADRVRFDLSSQVSRGKDGGIQPWISLVVGSTFDLGKKDS